MGNGFRIIISWATLTSKFYLSILTLAEQEVSRSDRSATVDAEANLLKARSSACESFGKLCATLAVASMSRPSRNEVTEAASPLSTLRLPSSHSHTSVYSQLGLGHDSLRCGLMKRCASLKALMI